MASLSCLVLLFGSTSSVGWSPQLHLHDVYLLIHDANVDGHLIFVLWGNWVREKVARHQLHKRSEEHTSELQSLMRISYAVFCLKKKTALTTARSVSSSHTTRIQMLNHRHVTHLHAARHSRVTISRADESKA